MSARGRMTMRATVTRDITPGTNTWGGPVAPEFDEVGVIDCLVWSRTKRDVTDAGISAVVEDMRAMVPAGSDVQQDDRLTNVRDRLGVVLYAGPIVVEAVVAANGSGSKAGHWTLMLKRNL